MFEYINYHWNAKKRHGIHSPFVYELSDQCLCSLVEVSWKKDLRLIDETHRKNNTSISISDFGAGSKKMGTERKISTIYKTSSTKSKYGFLLYRLSRHYRFNNILELGTSLGIGTLNLHRGNPTSKMTTVEACEQTLALAQKNFDTYALHPLHTFNGTFKDFLTNYSGEQFDLVYIDGHHDGIALLNYLELLEPHTHAATMFLIDDIRWSKGMFESWQQLVHDQRYHVSIDFFRLGLLVQRPEQEKEHFILRCN